MVKIKLIKRILIFIILVILIAILSVAGYLTYVDSNAAEAKNYLLDKYEINKKEWFAISYTEYIYDDIADCESLWLKKCTDDKNLQFKYTFINKEKKRIVVSEDKEGNFSDDYDGKLKVKEDNTNLDDMKK